MVLETIPTQTFPTSPVLPSCWQTTKQKKLHTELLTTAHPKARPLFICFFRHHLSFHDVNYVSSPFPMSPKFFHSHGPHTLADSSSSRRPPPRSSNPADCVFKTDDQPSVVSLSLYEDDMDLRSACSFSSELGDSLQFDVDLEMDDATPLAPFKS